MKRLLVQTQLSNYDSRGKFILECDSGWQMAMGRVREMLRLNPQLKIDVMCPSLHLADAEVSQVVTSPYVLNADLVATGRVRFIQHWIEPNALQTRYDFNVSGLAEAIGLGLHKNFPDLKYDAVYINDPMHLRAFKAMFLLKAGYRPRFYVHSHFVDVPSCPKFPEEASLWFGQLEAAYKADWNFWQCESAMKQFLSEADGYLQWFHLNQIIEKSTPWDDGYSQAEITSPIDMNKVRFSAEQWQELTRGKHVVFFPNRISPSSGDYTNGMKFMFDILPELRKRRQDFVVVCGNPNQKFSNAELQERCGPHGYVSLVPDSFNRDEFKFVARHSDVAVGLYDKDAYGGTAARECIELGCMPCWLALNEYDSLAREAGVADLVLVKPDFSDLGDKLFGLFDLQAGKAPVHPSNFDNAQQDLREVVQRRCSYEATTEAAMFEMGLLNPT